MASGIKVTDECLEKFSDFKKIDRSKQGTKFICFKLNDNSTQIVFDKEYECQGSGPERWDQFCSALPEKEPVWAAFDFGYKTADERENSKIIFVSWLVSFLFQQPTLM